MFKYLIIIIIVILFVLSRTYKIKWKTFFRKGIKINNGKWGVYCYVGKQGRGKTLSVVSYLLEQSKKGIPIYANISSLKGIDYSYFNGFDSLLDLRDKHDCIIVYDEIFTALTRTSKINTDVLDFLSQMRKRHIVFITTAQEWLEISITLRRYCRYEIECNIFTLPGLSILIKKFYDAESMKWSQDDNEYVAPLLEVSIEKVQKRVANSYDTHEQIKS